LGWRGSGGVGERALNNNKGPIIKIKAGQRKLRSWGGLGHRGCYGKKKKKAEGA